MTNIGPNCVNVYRFCKIWNNIVFGLTSIINVMKLIGRLGLIKFDLTLLKLLNIHTFYPINEWDLTVTCSTFSNL